MDEGEGPAAGRDERRIGVRFSDLSSSARIREVALQMFAERGVETTSFRMVAKAAGVSLGAVVHHYPTKDALQQAVRDDVARRIVAAVHGVGADSDSAAGALQRRNRAFDALLAGQPYLADYIRQVLGGGGTEALEFAQVTFDAIRSEIAIRTDEGQARPVDEVEMVLYWLLVSARFLIPRQLEALAGLDLSDPRDVGRLHDAEVRLLTVPLFLKPAD